MSGYVDLAHLATLVGSVVTRAADCYRCEQLGRREGVVRALLDVIDDVDEMALLFPREEIAKEAVRRDER